MFYAIITSVLTLSRNDLKKKVSNFSNMWNYIFISVVKKIIDNAHVISVIIEAPKLQSLIDSLYACDYKKLMLSVSLLFFTFYENLNYVCEYHLASALRRRFS